MKKIIVLGNSVAAVSAIETIREKNQDSKITWVGFDGFYPYRCDLIPEFIKGNLTLNDVYYRSKDFFEKQKVNVILERTITRMNFKRNKIFLDDKTHLDYDILLITGTLNQKFPNIKGTNKDGVFSLRRLKDIEHMIQTLPFTDTVVVQSSNLSGLQAASAFLTKGKEVIFVTPSQRHLGNAVEEIVSQWITNALVEQGAQVIFQNFIKEILGNGDVKAVRLDSGKVLAAQGIVFTEQEDDLKLFTDSALNVTNGYIQCKDHCRTNIENVYAVGHCCDFDGALKVKEDFVSASFWEQQGKMVAAQICEEGMNVSFPLVANTWTMNNFSLDIVGDVYGKEGYVLRSEINENNKILKMLMLQEDCPVGTILINAQEQKERFVKVIERKASVSQTGGRVRDENGETLLVFDVPQDKGPEINQASFVSTTDGPNTQERGPETSVDESAKTET